MEKPRTTRIASTPMPSHLPIQTSMVKTAANVLSFRADVRKDLVGWRDALRYLGDSRGAGTGSYDRRNYDAGVLHLDLRASRSWRTQRIRIQPDQESNPQGPRGLSRGFGGRKVRSGVRVRKRCCRCDHASAEFG